MPGDAKKLASLVLSARWIRFGLVGGAATLTYYLLGLLFVNLMAMPLLAGNGAAYILSFFVSYAGQSRWTFQAKGPESSMLARFAAAQAAGLAINSAIIAICSRIGMIYELSMLVAIVIVPVFVYLICKYWVFPAKAEQ